MNEFISTFLVVWRETFEGLLVLFLLSTRLIKENMWVRSKKFVGLGVVAGVTFSLVTAVTLFKIEDVNDSPWALNLRWILPIIASFLMVHMVFWMAKHGKEVSGNIKNLVTQSEKKSFYWGITGFITYAVAREGFETVIFLYGLSLRAASQGTEFHYAWPALAGFAGSVLTVWILKTGLSYFNLKYFFRITNLFLIGTALSLFVAGMNVLIELEYLSPLVDPFWDTSMLIPGSSVLGKVLSTVIGYNPRPSATLLIAYGLFCVMILIFYVKNLTASTD